MDEIIQVAQHVELLRYTLVAVLGAIVYEYTITFDNEIHYLWGRRLSLASVLLFVGRYLPIVSLAYAIYVYVLTRDVSGCHMGGEINAWLNFVEFIFPIAVLFTRAYAVWGGAKWVLIVLATSYVASFVGAAYPVSIYLKGISHSPIRVSTGCLFVVQNDDIWISIIFLIYCESLALGLLLVKAIQYARFTRGLDKNSTNLMTVMTQDGIGYFVCNLGITITNLICLARLSPDIREIMIPIQAALQNSLCNRLLFHIRIVAESRVNMTLPFVSYPTTLEMNAARYITSTTLTRTDSEVE